MTYGFWNFAGDHPVMCVIIVMLICEAASDFAKRPR